MLAIAITGTGLYLAAKGHGWAMLAAGCTCLVAVLVTWPITLAMDAARVHRKEDQNYALSPITDRLVQMSNTLAMISNQQLLSDRAKSIAYRKRDLEALR